MSKVLSLVALLVVLLVPAAHAQDVDIPDCVHQLDPCGPFVNSTTSRPPTTCCQPLEDVIQNDLLCICNVFSSIELIQTLSVNVTEAVTLPQRCGLQFDIIAQCQALLAPSEAPSTSSPKAVASTSGNMSGAGSTAWTGPILSGAFLVWATLMFC